MTEDLSKKMPLLMLWVGFTAGIVLGLTRYIGDVSPWLFALVYSIAFISFVWAAMKALEKASVWGGPDV